MKRFKYPARQFFIVLVTVILAAMLVLGGRQSADAQSTANYGLYGIGACGTTDYAGIVANMLKTKPEDLRIALVSGQALEDIAFTQNVAPETIKTALLNGHLAEIDQAVTDGLMTSQQAQQLKTSLINTNRSTPRIVYPIYFLPQDVPLYNFQAVKLLPVAAQMLDLKCVDLVKLILTNRSLVAITASRGGQIGAMLDALIKAYQTALDQDIKEQLITAAQAKGLRVSLVSRVTSLVNQVGPSMLLQLINLSMGTFPTGIQPYASSTLMQGTATAPLPPVRATGTPVYPGTLPATPISTPTISLT